MRSVVQQQEKVESKNNAIWSETIWNWLCIEACETKHQKSSASGILSLTRIDKQISVVCYSYFNISNDIILYIIKCEFFEFNSLRSWYIALRDSPSIAYNTAIVLVSGVTPPTAFSSQSSTRTHALTDGRTDGLIIRCWQVRVRCLPPIGCEMPGRSPSWHATVPLSIIDK